jgi:hypothetical protein
MRWTHEGPAYVQGYRPFWSPCTLPSILLFLSI